MLKQTTSRNIPTALRIAPWFLLACVFMLAGTLLFFSIKAPKQESAAAILLTKEKGASLIHAFETTLLSTSAWTGVNIDQILHTQANRNDIYFMAITDKNGKVISTSHNNLLGKIILDEKMNTQPPRFVYGAVRNDITIENQESDTTYLIHKQLFVADTSLNRVMKHGHRMRKNNFTMRNHNKNGMMDERTFKSNSKSCPVRPFLKSGDPTYMVIGFDVQNIMNALHADDKRSQIQIIALSFLVLLGIFSFFILRAYQRSYRMTQESKAYTLALVDALPLGIITLDTTQNIVTMNPNAEKILGYTEKERKHIGQIIPQLVKENFEKDIHNATFILGKPHENTLVEISSFPIASHETGGGHVIIIRDLQAIQQLQAQLHKHERLASIGKLAAGIAHEIRNPLSAIKGLARLFEENADKDSDNARLAGIMSQEVMRVDKVVSDLLSFSKPDAISLQKVSLHELFKKAINSVLPHSTKSNVTFINVIDELCNEVVLDDDRIMQVLQNLFLNAIQAMPQGGQIELQGRMISTPNKIDSSDSEKYLEISICDNGIGIPKNQLKNLFTPYFTSKAKGTGLGLVMVQKIIEVHKGTISIESEENVGTCVIMRFPQ